MVLPRRVGSFTLMRKLDADGLSEAYAGILEDPPGRQIVARRLLPVATLEPHRLPEIAERVGDLRPIRHPGLAQVLDWVEADGEHYVLEEWADGIALGAIIRACASQGLTLPQDLFLHLATQLCNALEGLHAQPGAASGSDAVLHAALNPECIWVTTEGRVVLGRYGLTASPTVLASSLSGPLPSGIEYLAPEQTHQDPKLGPAADIFALGAVLYELLTLRPLFRADTSLQTIHRIRRAEVSTPMLEVKDRMPGLHKLLYRALSLNPRHRYQRAFVLREDLRGLMAGYTFSDIDAKARQFVARLAGTDDGDARSTETELETRWEVEGSDSTASLLADLSAIGAGARRPPPAHLPDDLAGARRRTTPSREPHAPSLPPLRLDFGSPSAPDPDLSRRGRGAAPQDPREDTAALLEASGAFLGPTTATAPSDAPASTAGALPPLRDDPPPRSLETVPAYEDRPEPYPSDDPLEPEAAPSPPYGLYALLVVAAVVPLTCAGAGALLALQLSVGPPRPPSASAPPLETEAPAAVAAPNGPAPAPEPPEPVVSAPVRAPEPLQPPPPPPARETWEAVRALSPAPEPPPRPDPVEPAAAAPVGEIDRWSDPAFRGELPADAIAELSRVGQSDPDFTRARTLLYLDATARGDQPARKQHLEAALSLPENQYNPVLLVETASIALTERRWDLALAQARAAEQHWARLPSELVFTRKAAIYEIQALAETGLFYASEGEDRGHLDRAILGWERYRRHVLTKSRSDLAANAEARLNLLRETERRMD